MSQRAPFILASLVSLSLACGVDVEDPTTDDTRDALLFGLTDEDVEQIHADYAADEDIEALEERLTAPFDCGLYGDFCAQVGAEAAEDITEQMVLMALDEVPLAEIEAQSDVLISEAMDVRDDSDEDQFRSSNGWSTQTSGNYRLRVRNGVTSPVVGNRKAWTEAKAQKKGWTGVWANVTATQLCVNAGTNTQVLHSHPSNEAGTTVSTFESINPSNSCASGIKTRKSTTYHTRNNGIDNVPGFPDYWTYYMIHARGCASAEINGINFSRCNSTHSRTF